jgi:hypothetical protein
MVLLLVAVAGCGVWACDDTNGPGTGDTYFESADPSAPGGEEDFGGSEAPEDGADADADGDGDTDADADASPEREIEEADIIKLEGDVLYALSAYRGLVVIDVSDPDHLEVIGRHAMYGMPFEMYVRDGIAYCIYSSFWVYVYNEETGGNDWVSTSRIVGLDVTDPDAIVPVGNYDLAGEISDSRIVGDVLYAVAFENGWCWRCESSPQTTITALNIADPENIIVRDRLAYSEDDAYGWRRSITVTTDRMYVSGMNWDDDWESSRSTIQVVDISDPSGVIAAGAQVEVAGQITSRWQMDEYDGVLRVVSQPGGWWGGETQPVVETFEVHAANDVRPLGRLEMTLPRPEQLMSVRFDGARGYAVTFQRTDPLFIIDLSDPAVPEQRGQVEIPGWLYHMEPRGDRLFALGFEDSGSLQVSLFDVSDADNPTMLDRVGFGGDWGWMVEDQDRIHKAFRILHDIGLILMPFAGWSFDEEGYYGSFGSGIQMIDFTDDDLMLRAVIPHHGFARRAFIHRDHLFAMSDERVEAFDISHRDRPVRASGVTFSRNVYRVAPFGDFVAELVSDWWTGEARLDILPRTDPDGMQPVGSLDLRVLMPEGSRPYYFWYYGFNYYDSKLLTDDDHLILLWRDSSCGYWWDSWCEEGEEDRTGVAVFDVSDPTEPELVAQDRFAVRFPYQEGWWWSGAVEAGETIVQLGSTVVIRPTYNSWYWWGEPEERTAPTLEVLDFSRPERPRHAASYVLPGEFEMSTLQVADGLLLTSHREPVGEGRVRFFLDEIDVSVPGRPHRVRSVNIPGSPISFDADSGRLVTVDYQYHVEPAVTWEDCYRTGYYYDVSFDEEHGVCRRLVRTLNLLDVRGDVATLYDRLSFGDRSLRDVRVTGERVFVGIQPDTSWWWWDGEGDEPTVDPRPELIVVTGIDDGFLIERGSTRMSSPYAWLHAARGTRAIVLSDTPPAVDIYGSDDADRPERIEQVLLTGYGYDVHILDDTLVSANSMWGVQIIPLR